MNDFKSLLSSILDSKLSNLPSFFSLLTPADDDACLAGDLTNGDEVLDFCGDDLDFVEETELLRDEAAEALPDSLMEVDCSDDDLDSLAELSLKKSLAEDKFFGGELDLELADDDFLEDVPVELLELFLTTEAVELFLVEDC